VLGHILHSVGKNRSRALAGEGSPGADARRHARHCGIPGDEARATQTNGLTFAVNMLVNTEDGDTYRFSEIAGWLKEAGFENVRMMEAPGPVPLILANRAQ